jgi:hypothetical protein
MGLYDLVPESLAAQNFVSGQFGLSSGAEYKEIFDD